MIARLLDATPFPASAESSATAGHGPELVERGVTRWPDGLDQDQPPRSTPSFERPQDVIVESVDDNGERDDVAALGTLRSEIKDGPDEIAINTLRSLEVGR